MASFWRMRSWSWILGMGVYFTVLTHAEAGFIVAKAETVSQSKLETSSSASIPHPETPLPPQVDRLLKTHADPANGMSVPTSVVTHAGSSPGTPSNIYRMSLLLQPIVRLQLEDSVWLPPPFLTGIFRPPRFVV